MFCPSRGEYLAVYRLDKNGLRRTSMDSFIDKKALVKYQTPPHLKITYLTKWASTFTAPNFVMFEFVEISILLFTPFTRKHNSQPSPPCFTPPLLPLTSQFFLHHLFPCPQSFTSPPELYLALRHSHGSPVPIKIPFTSPSYPSFLTASNLQAYWTQHQNTLK